MVKEVLINNLKIDGLKAGDTLLLDGIIYTARDQAHKRLTESVLRKKTMPIHLKGQIIYYCGPTPAKKNSVIGSCGPTTSSRMDVFTPVLLRAGVKGMIGKGPRSNIVKKAIKKYRSIYFLTYAGCGALLSKCIKKSNIIAYNNLGPEAIYKLEVKRFPVIVGIDCRGKDVYGTNYNSRRRIVK